jgi:hypothetical protein
MISSTTTESNTKPNHTNPFDADLNVNGYRADWKLLDGTFVEALGFPDDPAYMAKAQHKIKLAGRHQISVLTVTQSDIARLASTFRKWLPRENAGPTSAELPPRPVKSATPTTAASPHTNGKNATNMQARAERLERCRQAVKLQVGGATRKHISDQLGVSEESSPHYYETASSTPTQPLIQRGSQLQERLRQHGSVGFPEQNSVMR